MNSTSCLNCGEPISKKFCPNCGQKTDTHRLTPKHFFFHDIVHGVWHLDKGILFTIKEAFMRPGQAALDYIKGKRVRYYNVFYLCLILLGLDILLGKLYFYQIDKSNISLFESFLENYSKPVAMATIPLLAFISSFIFKKMKLNIAEHFITAGFTMINLVMADIFFTILIDILSRSLFLILAQIIVFLSIIFLSYYNLGLSVYSKKQLFLKSFLLTFLMFLSVLFLIITGDVLFQHFFKK